YGDNKNPEVQIQVAIAMLYKGITLGQSKDSEAEIAVYDQMINSYGDNKNPEVQIQVARAMFNKGITLGQSGDVEAEIAVYDQMINSYGDNKNPEVQIRVAKAMLNKGITLGQSGGTKAAIAVYDQMINSYGDNKNPEVQIRVAKAMVNKGITLGQSGGTKAAIAVYDQMINSYGDNKNPEVQIQVAKAMLNKGITLGQSGGTKAAIAVYDQMINSYGDNKNPEVQIQVAKAMACKGIACRQSEDSKAAIAAYGNLIERYGDTDNEKLRELVVRAMYEQDLLFTKEVPKSSAIDRNILLIEKYLKDDNQKLNDINSLALLLRGKFLILKELYRDSLDSFKRYLVIEKLPLHLSNIIKDEGENARWLYALTSIYERCKKEINNAHFGDAPTEVCHFTNIKALYSILDYKKVSSHSIPDQDIYAESAPANILRGYNAIYMNDPSEGRALVEYSHKNTLNDLTDFFKEEGHWVEHDAGQSVFSISFTSEADSLSLWRAYGRDGRGVCIVISTGVLRTLSDGKCHVNTKYNMSEWQATGKVLPVKNAEIIEKSEPVDNNADGSVEVSVTERKIDYDPMPTDIYKVRYISLSGSKDKIDNQSAEAFLGDLNEHIKTIKKIKDKCEQADKKKIDRAVREAFAGALYLFKDAQYAAEQEYRMITLRRINADGIFFDDAEIPRLYLKTKPFVFESPGTRIILGPGVEDPEAVQLSIRRIIALNPKFDKDIKVEYSKVQYRPKTDEAGCPIKKY
ncbi:MAG: tetratricopeptide repeat protein, partial [Victivallaceae bacterium]